MFETSYRGCLFCQFVCRISMCNILSVIVWSCVTYIFNITKFIIHGEREREREPVAFFVFM